MKKIKLFTHNDTDGAGCAIVLKSVFPDGVFSVTPCTYSNMEQKLSYFLSTSSIYSKFFRVFFTDLAIGEHFSELPGDNMWVFDHHPLSLELKHENKVVDTDRSATKLVYDYFKGDHDLSRLRAFVTLVDDYDLQKCEYNASRYLNYLYFRYWSTRFIERFKDGDLKFTDNERNFIRLKEKKFRRLLEKLETTEFFGGKLVVICLSDFVNEASAHLLGEGAEVVLSINPKFETMSLRSQQVNVEEIAKDLGGGGHPMASGIPMDSSKSLDSVIKRIGGSL